MKYLALLILVFLLSCKKGDTDNCVECRITYLVTTDVPVEGYPLTTTTTVEICNVTDEEITSFEQSCHGTETVVVENVTYTSSYSTVCDRN